MKRSLKTGTGLFAGIFLVMPIIVNAEEPERTEQGFELARAAAPGRFEAKHVGTEFREDTTTELALAVGHVEDTQPFQQPHDLVPPAQDAP